MKEEGEKTENKKYFEAVGRRKSAVARVRIYEASKTSFVINDRDILSYFPTEKLRITAKDAFTKPGIGAKFRVTGVIRGGGQNSQAEALRHGIARALILYDSHLRKELKSAGFLKRDPRAKERRKFGLKKARKAPQWSKR